MATSEIPLEKVFTPTGFPIHTYVDRNDAKVERSIRNAFETPGTVVSISGPSKSGKTVLIKKIVGGENLIQVSGGSIQNTDSLWSNIVARMSLPVEETESATQSKGGSQKKGLTIGVPKVAAGELSRDNSRAVAKTLTRRFAANNLDQIVHELSDADQVIFVDDFHYMNRTVQNQIAKQIKYAAEAGVKICVASVPHRSDDVVRSNPELRGRTVNIDTAFWSPAELSRIGEIGFPKTGLAVEQAYIERLADEACGSPQLMQALCLEFGRTLQDEPNRRVDEPLFHEVLGETSKRTDYTSLIKAMHQGPRLRRERNQFDFTDGTTGDVYRAVLLALSSGDPTLEWNYVDLRNRIAAVCIKERPTGSSFVDASKAISTIARQHYPAQRILEWDPTSNGTLSIVDPYFLFFIRQSGIVEKLGRARK